ncbi:MFS transporter [Promicromonospora sp. NPDC050880]|uniref:MFS transporter n=1 Tax=Promicromonospora sp. NPDC050880 TaxID=3364406 RepID=UPI00379E7C62
MTTTEPAAPGDEAAAGAVVPVDPARHLRTPLFRTLVVGWTLANVADSLLTLLMAVWVADLTGSAALGGMTFALLGLPALASPFLGHLADRVSRRRMLVLAYVTGALGLVPLFWVTRPDQVWVVFASTLVYSAVAYVTGACQSGILKDLLPDEALGHANGRLSMIDQVLRVALPVLGAAVYALVGVVPLVAVAIAGFVGAALVFLLVRITESRYGDEPGEAYLAAITAGFRHLFRTQPLGAMTWNAVIVFASVGLVNAVVFAVLDGLGLPAAWLGPVTVLQGVCGFVAGALTPRLMLRLGRPRVYALGILASGVALVPLMFGSVVLAVAGQALLGFGVTAAVIAWVTERQVRTPDRLQGRVAAAGHLLNNLPGTAVTALGAGLLAVVDYRLLVLANAIVVIAAGMAALRLREAGSAPDSGGAPDQEGTRGTRADRVG